MKRYRANTKWDKHNNPWGVEYGKPFGFKLAVAGDDEVDLNAEAEKQRVRFGKLFANAKFEVGKIEPQPDGNGFRMYRVEFTARRIA